MQTQFVCLANSYKEGGRCVAGILLENGHPVMENDKPKWIRPVCKTAHGEIPLQFVSNVNLLDIIEIDAVNYVPDGFQSENALFDTNSIKILGKFPEKDIIDLCDNSEILIFGNRGKAVAPEIAQLLPNSLRMLETENFNVIEKKYENNSNPKLLLSFIYNNTSYEIPITDPLFLEAYKANKDLLSNSSKVFIVISLGILYNNWHSKLVAGILY